VFAAPGATMGKTRARRATGTSTNEGPGWAKAASKAVWVETPSPTFQAAKPKDRARAQKSGPDSRPLAKYRAP